MTWSESLRVLPISAQWNSSWASRPLSARKRAQGIVFASWLLAGLRIGCLSCAKLMVQFVTTFVFISTLMVGQLIQIRVLSLASSFN